jgi:CRP-like cAMP-binding protein
MAGMSTSIELNTTASLLLTPDALVTLSLEDASVVAGYMTVIDLEPQTVVFKANQTDAQSDYMLLVLDGEVLIETLSSGDSTVVVNVLGAGHLIGEMSVLDGTPRSATCTAQTDVKVAKLTRGNLESLIEKHPTIAARFLMAIAKRLADRVRLGNHRLLMLSQVNEAMREEMNVKSRKRPHRFSSGVAV